MEVGKFIILFIPFLTLLSSCSASLVEVLPDGGGRGRGRGGGGGGGGGVVYSRVQVTIEEQPPPENCTEYLDNLEVGET